mmetsp:Transcript_6782/g.15377  ORF Transcript_6782/g.15377 Transcript_6782/m.15377 type:complete len:335 (-) Transcript_6782:195-1199(-)
MGKEEGGASVWFFAGAIVVTFAAAIAPVMMAPNKDQQRNRDAMDFFGMAVSIVVGLAVYLHYFSKRNVNVADDDDDDENDQNDGIGALKQKQPATEKVDDAAAARTTKPKDIWKVGADSQSKLKQPKAAYTEKPFGSKYYYAHNDSNTTGGYKDGLKMEDYRMNGPRLLSVNGLAVSGNDDEENNNSGDEEGASIPEKKNTGATKKRITARDPNLKKITKYLWDDPGNGNGIATIRVDVLPGDRLGEFIDWNDVEIKDVVATLPGEGLLTKITVGENEIPSYQLKIDKLYGDAAKVKVIIKSKRLLIKIYKKKHGYLSKNDNNLDAWPQPHRKI